MTHTKDEALKLALEALELHGNQYPHMVKGYCLDAITAIKQALEAPVQTWINPNDKTQRRFLPDIGDKVLFCNGGRVYYGHHTGGGFRTGQGVATKYFGTWDCHWMPIPPAHGITKG